MEKIKEEIQDYLFRRIGPSFYVSNLTSEDNEIYHANIGVAFPRFIIDDKLNKKYLRYIKFENIEQMNFSTIPILQPVSSYSREKILERAYTSLYKLNLETESIMLETIYPKLTELPFVSTLLNPIFSILADVEESGLSSLSNYKPNQRRYFDLLEQMFLIRRRDDGKYEEGNAFSQIREKVSGYHDKEVLSHVIGYAIKKGKSYLIEELKINVFSPYIKISNTYFYQTLETGELFNVAPETLRDMYVRFYPGLRYRYRSNFFQELRHLVKANIFIKERKFRRGSDEVFNEFNALAEKRGLTSILNRRFSTA
jgi:hypothetical protein